MKKNKKNRHVTSEARFPSLPMSGTLARACAASKTKSNNKYKGVIGVSPESLWNTFKIRTSREARYRVRALIKKKQKIFFRGFRKLNSEIPSLNKEVVKLKLNSSPKHCLPPKAEKKLKAPSLKDKGRAATEQPKDKFDRDPMISLGPSHDKLNKGYGSNPKLAECGASPKILVPDAFMRLEPKPAECGASFEILVSDTAKRSEPAWENFNKGFYRFVVNDKSTAWKIAPVKEDLRDPRRGTKIGDRKYFPAVSTE